MAVSPKLNESEVVSTTVLVEGTEIDGTYNLSQLIITHQINKIPRARVRIYDGNPVNPEFPISDDTTFDIGNKIEIKAGYLGDEESIFKGIITAHGVSFGKGAGTVVELECKDIAAKMTIVRRTATFEEKTDDAVIKAILGDNGISGYTVEASTYEHPKLVQYAATDWDFILARAQANSMIVTLGLGKMYVGPPVVSATPALVVTYGKDIISFRGQVNGEQQIDNFKCTAWEIKNQDVLEVSGKKPAVNSQGKNDSAKLAKVFGLKEINRTTSSPLEKDLLQAWGDAQLQNAQLARIVGEVSFEGSALAVVGELIELAGVGERLNGNAYISKVTHELEGGTWTTTASFGLPTEWLGANKKSRSVPAADKLLPSIGGLQIGTVKQIEEDPDGESRILVTIPIYGSADKGVWARLAQLYATADTGFYFFPEVGDEVILGCINNDPRFPVVLGMLYSSKLKPPFTPDKDNFIKAIVLKGKGGNMQVKFDEEKDIITIETPEGNKITLDDDQKSLKLEDPNKNVVTLSDAGVSIETPKDFKVDAKGKVAITAVSAIDIKASGGDVNLEGNNAKMKGKIACKVEGTQLALKGSAQGELNGGAQLTVKGAIVMIN